MSTRQRNHKKTEIAIDRPPLSRQHSEEYGYMTYLYSAIEPSEYKYNVINKDKLATLDSSEYDVSFNATQKTRYFLIFGNFNGINQILMIPYALHCSSDKIWCCHLCATDALFQGTIVDGELIQNSLGELHYLITDVYTYCGENWKTKPVAEKRNQFRVSSEITYNIYISSFHIAWIDIFESTDIPAALQSDQSFAFNGLLFLRKQSGIRLIYRLDAVSTEIATVPVSPRYETGTTKMFTISATNLPDVFPLQSNEVSCGYLSVPTMKLSLKLRELVKDGGNVTIKCIFNGNKWEFVSKKTTRRLKKNDNRSDVVTTS